MKFHTCAFVIAACAAGLGCSNDNGKSGNSGGTGGAGGSGGSGGTTGGTGGMGGSGGSTLPTNQCVSEADAWRASYPGGEGGTMTVTDFASTCGVQCLSATDPIACTNDCIQGLLPGGAISASCTKCAAYSVDCFIHNCVAECAANPKAPACVACGCGENTAGVNCIQDYSVACSGVPNTEFCSSVHD